MHARAHRQIRDPEAARQGRDRLGLSRRATLRQPRGRDQGDGRDAERPGRGAPRSSSSSRTRPRSPASCATRTSSASSTPASTRTDGKDLRYLVMELVEGTSLAAALRPAGAAADRRAPSQIAYKCCKALEYANTRRRRAPRHQARQHHAAAATSTSRSPTSAPRSSRAPTPRRSRASARPPTCRPSRSAAARRSTSAPTCSRSAA